MATLYEMTDQVKQLLEMLENDDIDEQSFNDTVEAMGVNEKIEGYCQIINQLEAYLPMFDDEIKRLTAKKKTVDNRIAWLKGQLLHFYICNGRKKLTAGTFTVSSRTSRSVDIQDESQIPQEYLKAKWSPDKTAIKEALNNGVEVKGTIIKESESVQIK